MHANAMRALLAGDVSDDHRRPSGDPFRAMHWVLTPILHDGRAQAHRLAQKNSRPTGAAQTAKATTLSDYERQRQQNVERNHAQLKALGLPVG